MALAEAYLKDNIIARRMTVTECNGPTVEPLVLATPKFVCENPILEFSRLKAPMRLLDRRFVGWLSVGWDKPTPLLLVRPDYKLAQKAVDLFMKDPINAASTQ